MILTVTLNAALDVTYTVGALVPHTTHRVQDVAARAGGKGINVARVLSALGHEVMATGLAGGATGAAIRADLAASGLPHELCAVGADSRRTVTVTDGRDATGFHEPGSQVSAREWDEFRRSYTRLVRAADVVVCSGSLPAGLPSDAYAVLVGIAAAYGVRTVVDSDGAPLRAALGARPDVVKPNAAELLATTDVADSVVAADALRAGGAGAVVATLGAEGLLALTEEGAWRVRPPDRLDGNPTGAGDACAAGLAAGLAEGTPWPERLREAAALSVAAVAVPVAGAFDEPTYRRVRAALPVEVLPCR